MVKSEEKKTTAAKAADTKKTAASEKKTAVKTTAAKKPAARKPAAAKKAVQEPEATVTIQYAGRQIVAKEVLEAAKKAYVQLRQGSEIKTIELYIKPEENAAYYVVNGEGCDEFKVEF